MAEWLYKIQDTMWDYQVSYVGYHKTLEHKYVWQGSNFSALPDMFGNSIQMSRTSASSHTKAF
jgi:hypothetical protein